MNKTIYLFAGPNGSGKSTIVREFITKGYAPEYFVCPDNLVDHKNENIRQAYLDAMKKAEEIRYKLVNKGQSFSFESVLSNSQKLDFLHFAKINGFFISLVYVGTENPKINIERVKNRVAHGGHDVPEEKINSRYEKSLNLLSRVFDIADKAYIYDNSNEMPKRYVIKSNGLISVKTNPPEWIKKYLLEKL
jgi:predicted ABC-type ATPase